MFDFRQKLGLLSNFSNSWAYKNTFSSGKVPKLEFFEVNDFVRSLPCVQSLPLDFLNRYNFHRKDVQDFPVGINTFTLFNIYYLYSSIYSWFIFSSFYFSNDSLKNDVIPKFNSFKRFPYNFNAYGTYSTRNYFSERISLLRKKKEKQRLTPKNNLIRKFKNNLIRKFKNNLIRKFKNNLIRKFKNNLRAFLKVGLKNQLKLKNSGQKAAAAPFFNAAANAIKKGKKKTKQFVCFIGFADKHQIHLISKKKNYLKFLLKFALKPQLKIKIKIKKRAEELQLYPFLTAT